MYRVVRSSRLYEQIVERIEDSIERGDLKEEDRYPRNANSPFSLASAAPPSAKQWKPCGRRDRRSMCGRGAFFTMNPPTPLD